MTTALLLATLFAFALQDPQPAATAAPAKAQPQIEWQRSLDDALAVQQATKKPLLLVLNIDGETFCEQFANRTYRDEAFVATTRGYVCLIASGERHTESDYDGQGRRIECPRFGGCTCSEHINNGVRLFAKYFKGESAAPRHNGIAPDGKVLFDRFLDRSMQTAIDAVKEHMAKDADAPLPSDVQALLARRDAGARRELERRYLAADAKGRIELLTAAAASKAEPFDLLRMGLRSDDDAIFLAAAQALGSTATKDALIDLEDALARADDIRAARSVEAALLRLAKDDALARQFVAHLQAVRAAAPAVSAEPFFASMLRGAAPVEPDEAERALDAAERAARTKPTGTTVVHYAQMLYTYMQTLPPTDKQIPLLLEDCARFAQRALATPEAGDAELRTGQALLATVRWQQGDRPAARTHAEAALGLCRSKDFDASPPWVAELFRVAARSAAAAAYEKAQKDATAVVADDLRAAAYAFQLLVSHAACSDADLREAATLYAFAGARAEAQALLTIGLGRFAASRDLHADYRNRILADRGAEALRARYREHVASAQDKATASWFAGYAAIVAAEVHVKDHRAELATAAYGDCIAQFAASAKANDGYADSANHFTVLALAGRALLRHESGDDVGAVDDLLAARTLRPASMGDADGLGRKPEALLQRIEAELRKAGKTPLADKLTKNG